MLFFCFFSFAALYLFSVSDLLIWFLLFFRFLLYFLCRSLSLLSFSALLLFLLLYYHYLFSFSDHVISFFTLLFFSVPLSCCSLLRFHSSPALFLWFLSLHFLPAFFFCCLTLLSPATFVFCISSLFSSSDFSPIFFPVRCVITNDSNPCGHISPGTYATHLAHSLLQLAMDVSRCQYLRDVGWRKQYINVTQNVAVVVIEQFTNFMLYFMVTLLNFVLFSWSHL